MNADLTKEALIEYIISQLKDVNTRLSLGKGEWPKPNYIKDDTWHEWIGKQLILRKVLHAAGIDPGAL